MGLSEGSGTAAPVTGAARVVVLDVLRGMAILGMWIVNMTLDVPWSYRIDLMPMRAPDATVATLIALFCDGKFYTIFSFLFGVGVFVQVERVRERGRRTGAFMVRRSAGLAGIAYLAIAGTIGGAWILVDYALLGVVLLLFVDCRPKVILWTAAVCLLVGVGPARIAPELEYVSGLRERAEEQAITLDAAARQAEAEEIATGLAREPVVRARSFRESSASLLRLAVAEHTDWHYWLDRIYVLGLMLAGLYAGRLGAVWDADIRQSLARVAVPWLLGVGAAATVIGFVVVDVGAGDAFSVTQRVVSYSLRDELGASAVGLGYAAGLVLLYARARWRRLLKPFAAVGRMALTCYLFTLLVDSFINQGWGLGQFGHMMPAAGAVVVLIGFPPLAVVCNLWLRRFRFGPIEWVWRSITYGQIQPMRTVTSRH